MIATGYVRRSKKAEDNTVSLQEQEKQINDYCAAKGFTLAGIVAHNGISGAKRSRWIDINKAIVDSQSRALVIYNLDRLSRDAVGLLDNLRLLAASGVSVHEVGTGKIDLSKSTSKLTTGVRGLMDEFYRDVISEKTSDALRYKRENGKRYTNIPPLGFSYHAGLLVEDPLEQVALSVIERCKAQGLGARRTQKALLKTGYHGRMGLATIHRLLHRDVKEKLPPSYFALPEQ